jgi:hypothetical protein
MNLKERKTKSFSQKHLIEKINESNQMIYDLLLKHSVDANGKFNSMGHRQNKKAIKMLMSDGLINKNEVSDAFNFRG